MNALSAADSWLDLPTGRIAYRRWGRGKPVLCLHAVGHGSGDFTDLAQRLGDGFELIALDWPAMGLSPADGAPVRAEHFAGVALAACEALALERPIILGNSIGGAAAIIAASKAPGRFAGLVLCNPGGLRPIDSAFARAAIRGMVGFFAAGARGAPWFPTAFAYYYRHLVLTRPNARTRCEAIAAAGPALAPVLADAWSGFAEPYADIRVLMPRLDLPVWFAWAKSDAFVAWSGSRAAALSAPQASVTLFRGGHCAFLEDPEAFVAGFRGFVQAHGLA